MGNGDRQFSHHKQQEIRENTGSGSGHAGSSSRNDLWQRAAREREQQPTRQADASSLTTGMENRGQLEQLLRQDYRAQHPQQPTRQADASSLTTDRNRVISDSHLSENDYQRADTLYRTKDTSHAAIEFLSETFVRAVDHNSKRPLITDGQFHKIRDDLKALENAGKIEASTRLNAQVAAFYASDAGIKRKTELRDFPSVP